MSDKDPGSGIDFGSHFRLEDGSHLVVAGKKKEGRDIISRASEGDVVFCLAREMNAAAALVSPAGGQISAEQVEKAAGIIALCLAKRGIRYDITEKRIFRIAFGVFPASPSIIMPVCPAAEIYYNRRSLHPAKRKKALKKMTEEISFYIERGESREALALAEEIKELPADYKRKAVKEIVKRFAATVRRIEKDGRFGIPLLLSGHKSLIAVLEKLDFRAEDGYSSPVPGAALVVFLDEDSGETRGVVMDLLRAAGYSAVDGGAEVGADEIFEAVKREKPAMLFLCGLMLSSFSAGTDPLRRLEACRASVERLMEFLERENFRGDIGIFLCGFAFNRKFSEAVSADGVYRSLDSLLKGLFERSTGKGE